MAVPARATPVALAADLSKVNPIYQAVQTAAPRVIDRVAAVDLPRAALVDRQAAPD